MDSLPPSPPPLIATAPIPATSLTPLSAKEKELCDAASTPDYLYMGIGAVLAGGGFAAEYGLRKGPAGVRLLAPAAQGVTWGFFMGSIFPSLSQCSDHWVPTPPREGSFSSRWPIALAIAGFAGITAPIGLGIATGYEFPKEWSVTERQARLVISGLTAFGGALLPYVLPPRTWAARKELERLRFEASPQGFYLGWHARF